MFDPRHCGARCDSCPLGPKGALRRESDEPWSPVPPELHAGAVAIAVAENPASEEVRQGRPLVGDSGVRWNRLLAEIGHRRPEIDLDNVLSCKIPGPPGSAYARMEKWLAQARQRVAAAALAAGTAKTRTEADRIATTALPHPADCCRPRLLGTLRNYRNVIALGAVAAGELRGAHEPIHRIRGGPELWPERDVGGVQMPEQKLIATFHPAYVLRAKAWAQVLRRDLAKAFRFFDDALLWAEPEQLYQPSPEELHAWLAVPAPFWVIDIETDGIEPLSCGIDCIGIATPDLSGDGRAVADFGAAVRPARCVGISLRSRKARKERHDDRLVSEGTEAEYRRLVSDFLNDPTRVKVGHNLGGFDRHILKRWCGADAAPFIDTLFAARFAAPDLPKGLKTWGTLLTDVDRWETTDKGTKIATGTDDDAELVRYCARGDCTVNARITAPLLQMSEAAGAFVPAPTLVKPPHWPAERDWNLFEIDHATQEMCWNLHVNGIHVDQRRRTELETYFEVSVARRLSQLQKIAANAGFGNVDAAALGDASDDADDDEHGSEAREGALKPGSYDQVRDILYKHWRLGCPPLVGERDFVTKSGLPGTGDFVLRMQLARHDLSDVQRAFIGELRLYRRERNKVLGAGLHLFRPKSLDPKHGKVWPDGRIRATFSAHTTSVGRLSCSNPNLQTLGARKGLGFMRSCLVAPLGHILVGADFDQLHLRIAANYWQIPLLLDAFERGIDPHCALAYAIFGDKFSKAGGWTEVGGFDLRRKPAADSPALAMREALKTFRYASIYGADPLTIWKTVVATETPRFDAAGNLIGTNLPYLKYRPSQIEFFHYEWLRAEPEWLKAWEVMKEDFRRQGHLESPLLRRRSGGLEEGKDEAVINYRILACETDILRKAECEVQAAFPWRTAGPGMILQTHDSIDVDWADPGDDEGRKRLRGVLEEAMTVRVEGWPVAFTVKAKAGRNLAEV